MAAFEGLNKIGCVPEARIVGKLRLANLAGI
jgi:hypothetical protein